MNTMVYRVTSGCLVAALVGISAAPADACLFGLCRGRHKAKQTAAVAPVAAACAAPVAVAAAPVAVAQTQWVQRAYVTPVTSYETRTAAEPVTAYQTSIVYDAVAGSRISAYFDPCTGAYQNVVSPVTTYVPRAQVAAVTQWVTRNYVVPVTRLEQRVVAEPVTQVQYYVPAVVPAAPAVATAMPTVVGANYWVPLAAGASSAQQLAAPPTGTTREGLYVPPQPTAESKEDTTLIERFYQGNQLIEERTRRIPAGQPIPPPQTPTSRQEPTKPSSFAPQPPQLLPPQPAAGQWATVSTNARQPRP